MTYVFLSMSKKDENTLLEIILRSILPGLIIMPDMWRKYQNFQNRLAEYNYQHYAVNHSQNFINLLTDAHTESIEAWWFVIKRKLRKKRTNLKKNTI